MGSEWAWRSRSPSGRPVTTSRSHCFVRPRDRRARRRDHEAARYRGPAAPGGQVMSSTGDEFSFPFEGPLHEVFPALHAAQNSYMAQIDSLQAPDRKTHELIRLACTVIRRNA